MLVCPLQKNLKIWTKKLFVVKIEDLSFRLMDESHLNQSPSIFAVRKRQNGFPQNYLSKNQLKVQTKWPCDFSSPMILPPPQPQHCAFELKFAVSAVPQRVGSALYWIHDNPFSSK